MDTLAEVGLWNAAGATLLALFVIAAARVPRRPALVHALWVVVLLKFVAPAIVPIPVPWEPSTDAVPSVPTPAAAGSADDSRWPTGLDLGIGERLRPCFAACVTGIAALRPYADCLLGIWLAGAAIWFAIAALRVLRFQRMLAGSWPAPDDLQRQAARLAETLGLARAPELRLTRQPVSPMLWAVGPYARLVFPAELLKQLGPEARDTLLVHELAHFRRGDHWVRLLELLVAGLYWWHPLVWWGRRQLRQAEEECCDAWVVAELPQSARHYARALLDTLDYLSEARTASVAMASEIGGVRFVRRRLVTILRGAAPKRLSPSARLAVLLLAIVLLPVLPTFVDPPAPAQSNARSAALAPPPPRQLPPDGDAMPSQAPSAAIEDRQPEAADSGQPDALPAAAAQPPLADFWATAHSPDGRHSIHAEADGSIALVDNATGRRRLLDRYGVTSVAFSPDGRTFATGCWDHRARLWDAETGAELAALVGHADRVNSVAFSPDGATLVTGSGDHAVKLWSVNSRTELAALPRLKLPVNCVRFSPDGESLAVALGNAKFDEPGQVQIWSLETLSQRAVLPCESGVGAVVFTPGGEGLAAGEMEGRITLWDLPTNTPWSAYFVPPQSVSRAAFWAGVRAFDPTAPDTPTGA